MTKKKVLISKSSSGKSTQLVEKFMDGLEVKEPSISPESLLVLYDNSYIVSGLTDKIALGCDSGFKCDDEELKSKVEKMLDIEYLVKSRLLHWNVFFEVIENAGGEIIKLEKVLNTEIRALKWGDGYVMKVWDEKVYYNRWIPMNERKGAEEIYNNNKDSKEDDLVPNERLKCGWNPNLNAVINFQRISLKDKHYGDSIREPIITQVSLIGNMDGNLDKYFERWGVNISFLVDEDDDLNQEDFDELCDYLEDKGKWQGNQYSWIAVKGKVKKVDVSDKPVARDLLPYRKDLEKSCAIRLNIPYDLILSDNSNYASSKTAIEQMNRFLVKPEQNRLIKQIRYLFGDSKWVESLNFVSVDTKDDRELADIVNKLVGWPVLTPNEWREMVDKEPLEWGDELYKRNTNPFDAMDDKIKEIEKMVEGKNIKVWDVLKAIEEKIVEEVNEMYE